MAKKAAPTRTYIVKSPIWQDGEIVASGEIDLPEDDGAKLVAAGVVEEKPAPPKA